MIDLKCMVLALVLGASAAFVGGAATQAESNYPRRPITAIVPYAPGGTGDVVARIVGEKAGSGLGEPVVIVNRSGADGIIGAEFAARSKPDGYTLLLMATAHLILPSLRKAPYNWEHDFSAVWGVTATPLVIAVHSNSEIRSLADLAAKSNATPDGLFYASGGTGTISHLAAVRLLQSLKVNGTHVPYRGFSEAVQALMGDQVQFICATVADVVQLAKGGRFRLLAVTSEQRMSILPDVPTMAELGFADIYAASWNAYLVPTKTPSDIIDRLHDAYTSAANDASVHERLGKLGIGTKPMNRVELEKFLRDESARWRVVIEQNNIKIEH